MTSINSDLDRRRKVWAVLSELFLDIELFPKDFRRIALVLVESNYSEKEVREIAENEVAPILASNLSATAGVWSGFDLQWLEAAILRREKRFFSCFKIPLKKRKMPSAWESVLEEMRSEAKLP